jgi:hypothetical protein
VRVSTRSGSDGIKVRVSTRSGSDGIKVRVKLKTHQFHLFFQVARSIRSLPLPVLTRL